MRTIAYRIAYNEITGGVLASVLMSQLEYWFEKMKGPFFKFAAPCEHELYVTGASWIEELGFSKAEFRTAFKKIGTSYKSKKAFRASQDPFQGKMYLSYYDRIKKLTYYMRNDDLVNHYLKCCVEKVGETKLNDSGERMAEALAMEEKQVRGNEVPGNTQTTLRGNSEFESLSEDLQQAIQRCRRLVSANIIPADGISLDKYKRLLEQERKESFNESLEQVTELSKTKLSNQVVQKASPKEQMALETKLAEPKWSEEVVHNIVQLFHQYCPSMPKLKVLSASQKQRLQHLWEVFDGQLDVFAEVFHKVEVNDFLSGRLEHKAWQASFDWLIQEAHFRKVLEGDYKNYKQKMNKFFNTYKHNWDFEALERAEAAYIEDKLQEYKASLT